MGAGTRKISVTLYKRRLKVYNTDVSNETHRTYPNLSNRQGDACHQPSLEEIMRNKPYRVSRRRKHGAVWPVLLLLVSAVAVALLISGAWQMAEGKPFPPPVESDSAGTKSSKAQPSEPQSSKPESSEPESSSEPEKEPEPELPVFDGAVPESPPVDQSYFDDAVFVGDSITEGMNIYTGMENATILAYTGINFSTIGSTPVIKQEDGTRTVIMDELKKTQYGKVYVMLGGNEVRDMDKDAFLSRYEKVLDQIREIQPNAILYVQSMTPVTANNNYNMDNDRIDEYNAAILELCKRKGFYYLNVAECMKDSNGMLPTEASPKDGMHFAQEYFNKWFAYLKTHTVDSGGTAAVPPPAASGASENVESAPA